MDKNNEKWLKNLVENYKKNKPDIDKPTKPLLTEAQRKIIENSKK
jgi:hypothetical protein